MKKDWKDELAPASVEFMKDIINQVPDVARGAFVMILNNIAKPSKEDAKRLEKLDCLEAGGVDNWDGYDWALEDYADDEDDDNDN